MDTLTSKQKLTIIEQSLIADDEGRHDDALKLIQKMPLAPHLAMAAKEICGKEFLLNSGFDLSAAEVAYGQEWLTN